MGAGERTTRSEKYGSRVDDLNLIGGLMGVVAVNEKDVKLVKSGHGETKWLVPSKNGTSPEMMIRHWGPDTDIPVHSHPYHEMFYVLGGRDRDRRCDLRGGLVH